MPVVFGLIFAAAAIAVMYERAPAILFSILGGGLLLFFSPLIYHLWSESEKKAEAARLRERREREQREAKEKQEREAKAQQDEAARIQKATNQLAHDYGYRSGQIMRGMFPTGTGQFQIQAFQLPNLSTIVAKMTDPFWEQAAIDGNVGADMRDRLRYGAESVGSKDHPVWPKDYRGKDAHKVYLPKEWWYLFDEWVPFSFSDTERFTHHWCLGHNGTGKTTFLRHFINRDLDRVYDGECSLIVMDSKRLIREMRMLHCFEPNRPLHDRMTLIDADEPFPLNPFCLPKAQARSVILYMLANMSDASGLQTGALTFLVDAAMVFPNPTLRTIRNFFSLDMRKGQLPDHFEKMDEDTQFWFQNTFANLAPATRNGIQQRLTNFLKENELLDKMISADTFGLDMGLLGRGGRVLLVDTNRARFGKEGTNIFGRLIIALIDQLSSQRAEKDEKSLKPVFVYIDEAQDYIQSDPMFADILEKARAQKIALTVAHHHRGQIDARIEQSLENAGIKSECHDIGSVSVRTRREAFTLPISKLEFDHPDWTMDANQYRQLRERLRFKHPHKTASSTPAADQPLTQKF